MATAPTAERDYFTDHSVLLDPYDYFESIRASGVAHRMKDRDIVIVTGFAEGVDVLLNTHDYSSIINPDPLGALPFVPEGDDISAQIDAAHGTGPMELMVSYDGERHAAARSLLNPLFKPSRLKANEAFMLSYADEMVRRMVAKGGCELIAEVATPYVTMVIADLLGVPDDDREAFRKVIDAGPPPGSMNEEDARAQASSALMFMIGYFQRYLAERRANPQGDVMTELALAKFPDGSTPDLIEPVKAAMFLFAAGQDTSAKLIGNALRFLCENPEMQQHLRDNRDQIGPFLEETLRLEGSTKATFRVARRKTEIAGMEIPAGQIVVVALPAANRDPRRWDDPAEFRLNRPRIKEHLAFGRGAHTCAGAPLARAEVAVLLDRLLEHTSAITLSERHHGTPGNRRIDYEPSFIIRGIDNLHVEFVK
ncbi:MAG: cytochrome P450 [Novosphingobium sp.]